jgi:hypothetical protein
MRTNARMNRFERINVPKPIAVAIDLYQAHERVGICTYLCVSPFIVWAPLAPAGVR